jgi:SAGA-associated factor 73
LKTAAKAHIAQCLRLKKEKAQRKKEAREARERAREAAREEEAKKAEEENGDAKEEDSDEETLQDKKGKAAKKAAAKKPEEKGKKRKADGEADKGPKPKKKKDEPKAKAPKAKGITAITHELNYCHDANCCKKGPVDVERQCGVILPNGQPCARSLTCKSHSMGAKRAVAGRSLPYDMLLAAYQKKNQAKQQSRLKLITGPFFARRAPADISCSTLQKLLWMPMLLLRTTTNSTMARSIQTRRQLP